MKIQRFHHTKICFLFSVAHFPFQTFINYTKNTLALYQSTCHFDKLVDFSFFYFTFLTLSISSRYFLFFFDIILAVVLCMQFRARGLHIKTQISFDKTLETLMAIFNGLLDD